MLIILYYYITNIKIKRLFRFISRDRSLNKTTLPVSLIKNDRNKRNFHIIKFCSL